jgi:hypothetical protein
LFSLKDWVAFTIASAGNTGQIGARHTRETMQPETGDHE